MADVVMETMVLEGKRMVVSLDASGLLQGRGDWEGQLLVRSDLIGFRSERSSVHLYTFKMSERKLGGLYQSAEVLEFVRSDVEQMLRSVLSTYWRIT